MELAGGIPLRTFSGTLKRVRLDENETLAMLILDLAFPHFRGLDLANEQRLRIYSTFYGKGAAEQLAKENPRRRFSGGSLSTALPRGRYYSVCQEKPGDTGSQPAPDDRGVIKHELLAYANWQAAGPVMIFDWRNETDRSFLRRLQPEAEKELDAFHVVFFRKPGAASIMDVIFQEKNLDPDFDNDQWGGGILLIRMDANPFSFLDKEEGTVEMAYGFNIYYRFEPVQLERTVDLRYPDTQEAFVRTFCPALIDAHPNMGSIGGFLEMLPTLLSSERGGSHATDVIGSYLRAHGAEALIYPSARFNGYVRFRGDQLTDFMGWNLVDYRDAPGGAAPEFTEELFLPSQSGIRVECPKVCADFGYGSWKIRGVMEQMWNRFEEDVREYFRRR